MYKLIPVLGFLYVFQSCVGWKCSFLPRDCILTYWTPVSAEAHALHISVTPVFHLDFYLLLSEGIDSRQYSFWPLAIYGCVQSGNKQLCVCILPLLIITKFLESKYFVLFMFHQYVLICITSTQWRLTLMAGLVLVPESNRLIETDLPCVVSD